LGEILANLPHVFPGKGRLVDLHPAFHLVHLLDHHHRVVGLGQGVSGVDVLEVFPGDEFGGVASGSQRVLASHRDPVHGRRSEVRGRDAGVDGSAGHATQSGPHVDLLFGCLEEAHLIQGGEEGGLCLG